MRCSVGLFYALIHELGMREPEKGGIIGGKDGLATHFYYDAFASTSRNSYTPDVRALNLALRDWAKDGIMLMGIAHSHQGEYGSLSTLDIQCARTVLAANPFLKELEFPIILPESKEKWLVSYCVDRKSVRKSKLYFYDT